MYSVPESDDYQAKINANQWLQDCVNAFKDPDNEQAFHYPISLAELFDIGVLDEPRHVAMTRLGKLRESKDYIWIDKYEDAMLTIEAAKVMCHILTMRHSELLIDALSKVSDLRDKALRDYINKRDRLLLEMSKNSKAFAASCEHPELGKFMARLPNVYKVSDFVACSNFRLAFTTRDKAELGKVFLNAAQVRTEVKKQSVHNAKRYDKTKEMVATHLAAFDSFINKRGW